MLIVIHLVSNRPWWIERIHGIYKNISTIQGANIFFPVGHSFFLYKVQDTVKEEGKSWILSVNYEFMNFIIMLGEE